MTFEKNIQEGDLLSEEQLLELLGEEVFDLLLDCGLGQVGDLYVGRNIIDSLAEAANKSYKQSVSNPYLRNRKQQAKDLKNNEGLKDHQPKSRVESETSEEEPAARDKPSIRKAVRDELAKCKETED